MIHTHITLVGGQPIPVYLGIKNSKPDRVIYICSRQSKDEAMRIAKEFDSTTDFQIFDPVDLAGIRNQVLGLLQELEGQYISINISSGTKPWAYYFSQIFSNRENTGIFYVDQNNFVKNLKDFSQQSTDISMDVRFRLHNNTLKRYKRLQDYDKADFKAIERIKELREFNFNEFNNLANEFSKYPNETSFESKKGSKLIWNSDERHITIRMNNKEGAVMNEVFDSPNARNLFLNTGWFELEVARLLSSWDKVKEIRINCVFPSQKNSPKNEIDIIIDTGSKLLFVECKTQIRKETDIDKFASAVKVYGGMGSKALFVTDEEIKENAAEKCRDNKILTFSLKPCGGSQNCEKQLFQLLDNELYNINTK